MNHFKSICAILSISLGFGTSAFALGKHRNVEPDNPSRDPRLSFISGVEGGAQLQTLKQHLANGDSPWKEALASLQKQAATPIPGAVANPQKGTSQADVNTIFSKDSQRSQLALARATIAYLARKNILPESQQPSAAVIQQYLNEANGEMSSAVSTLLDKHCLNAITAAGSVEIRSQAYDLLRSMEEFNTVQGGYSSLTSLANGLYSCFHVSGWDMFIHGLPFSLKKDETNHAIRSASALGLAAIAIQGDGGNDGNKSYGQYSSTAYSHIVANNGTLAYQIAGGMYAEGTGYFQYSMSAALPYLFHYARYNHIATYQNSGIIGYGSARLDQIYSQLIKIETPSRQLPPIDNSDLQGLSLQALLVPGQAFSALDTPLDFQRLVWEEYKRRGFPLGSNALEVLYALNPPESFLNSADAAPEAAFPHVMNFPGEGAVLRHSDASDSGYVFITAESGLDRVHGRGHDSVDNLDFLFSSRGDFINVTGGYAGWTNTWDTNSAQQRSMVLVDGTGPTIPAKSHINLIVAKIPVGDFNANGSDANITSVDDEGEVLKASGSTGYSGAGVNRDFVLIDDGLLVINTHAQDNNNRNRRFDLLFQANASTKTGFQRTSTSADAATCYHTQGKSVPSCFLTTSQDDLAYSSGAQTDAFLGGLVQHMQADYVSSGASAGFLSIISTNPIGGAYPTMQSWKTSDGIAYGALVSNTDGEYLVIHSNGGTHTWSTMANFPNISVTTAGLQVFKLSTDGQRWEVPAGRVITPTSHVIPSIRTRFLPSIFTKNLQE